MSRSLISPFRTRLQSRGATVVVIVSGELDLATAPRLAQVLEHVSRPGAEVVVDLEEVDFMDCAGLQVLVRAADQLDGSEGGGLRVTPGGYQVRKLFQLTRADQRLHVMSPPAARPGLAAAA